MFLINFVFSFWFKLDVSTTDSKLAGIFMCNVDNFGAKKYFCWKSEGSGLVNKRDVVARTSWVSQSSFEPLLTCVMVRCRGKISSWFVDNPDHFHSSYVRNDLVWMLMVGRDQPTIFLRLGFSQYFNFSSFCLSVCAASIFLSFDLFPWHVGTWK